MRPAAASSIVTSRGEPPLFSVKESDMERSEGRRAHVGAVLLPILATAIAAAPATATADSSFTEFESGQVRPLALTPSGKALIAVNTPDNRVEIFKVKNKDLQWRDSVSVGLEP